MYLNLYSSRNSWPYASAAVDIIEVLQACDESGEMQAFYDKLHRFIVQPLLTGGDIFLVENTGRLSVQGPSSASQLLDEVGAMPRVQEQSSDDGGMETD